LVRFEDHRIMGRRSADYAPAERPARAYECQAGASVLCRLESFCVWVGIVIGLKPELLAGWVAIAEMSCATCLSTFKPSTPLTLCSADTGGDGLDVMNAFPS
jgi:hypothetical protein